MHQFIKDLNKFRQFWTSLENCKYWAMDHICLGKTNSKFTQIFQSDCLMTKLKLRRNKQRRFFYLLKKCGIVHTTYSWNIKWQKCAGMGLDGFIFRKINENEKNPGSHLELPAK